MFWLFFYVFDLAARHGNDLEISLHISLVDALTGFKRTFVHLDGHEVVRNFASFVAYQNRFYLVISGSSYSSRYQPPR